MTVFTSNFDGVQRAFVALSSGPAQYSSDGTAWTAMATFGALAFASRRPRVVVGRRRQPAAKVRHQRRPDARGQLHQLIFRAGDKSSSITALMVTAAGTLIIAKTDGLYTLTPAGDDHQLFPFLKFAAETDNGKAWGQFENEPVHRVRPQPAARSIPT